MLPPLIPAGEGGKFWHPMQTELPAEKKLPWRKIAAAGLVVLVAGILLMRGVDLRGIIARAMELIGQAGPVPFFLAMAVVPCAGVPMMAFLLTAAPAFSPTLGLGGVIGFSLLAIATNITIGYLLARRAFRPLLEWLLQRLGYRMPQAEEADAADLVIICRLTPGIPFCAQHYLCGLAKIPFPKYLLLSCIIAFPMSSAFVLFGEALMQGRGRIAFIAISLMMAFAATTHLVRRHYRRNKQVK
jgi:uncharacterized membrane protein YdjX (TVP38/TMEM64 family)